MGGRGGVGAARRTGDGTGEGPGAAAGEVLHGGGDAGGGGGKVSHIVPVAGSRRLNVNHSCPFCKVKCTKAASFASISGSRASKTPRLPASRTVRGPVTIRTLSTSSVRTKRKPCTSSIRYSATCAPSKRNTASVRRSQCVNAYTWNWRWRPLGDGWNTLPLNSALRIRDHYGWRVIP